MVAQRYSAIWISLCCFIVEVWLWAPVRDEGILQQDMIVRMHETVQRLLIIYEFRCMPNRVSLRLIRNLYLPYLRRWLKFPFDVTFYSPYDIPYLNVHGNGAPDNTFFSTRTFVLGYRNHEPIYTGYLFLSENTLLDPFRFNQHNFRKVGLESPTFYHGYSNDWEWYNYPALPGKTSWAALQEWFYDTCNSSDFSWLPMCKAYENGRHYRSFADCFYVPVSCASFFADLIERCVIKNVLPDLCIPNVGTNFGWNSLKRFETRMGFPEKMFGSAVHFHPVPLSRPMGLEKMKRYIKVTEERACLEDKSVRELENES
jgi:hypothetical protein